MSFLLPAILLTGCSFNGVYMIVVPYSEGGVTCDESLDENFDAGFSPVGEDGGPGEWTYTEDFVGADAITFFHIAPTSSGAVLDTEGPIAKATPGGLLEPYGRNGAERDAVLVQNLKAVVAIAPAGGGSLSAWGSEGLRGIHAPLLLIAGNHDQTVDYSTGAKAFFEGASDTTRYLLTYREGGHAIGLGPAPAEMRQDLWNTDWFEDPVWRKDRIIGINLHFITAFLDRYVKDDASRASYLELAVTDAAAGTWPQDQQGRWNEISPGTEGITVWKGFQRRHAQGLEWLRQDAATAAR